MTTAIFGTYTAGQNLENALDRLAAAGFPNNTISVLFPESNRDEGAGDPPGWLDGAEALAIPGFGPALAAGPVASALSGKTGGLAEALVGMGVPEEEATHYENRMLRGNMVILVQSDNPNSSNTARFILEDTGALEVSSCQDRIGGYATPR